MSPDRQDMNEITLMFLLLWSSGSHLTSGEAVLKHQSSGALVQKGPRLHRGCGVPAIKPKVPGCPSDGLGIINGEEAVPHSWPWQVSLQEECCKPPFCGGTLINKDWVVTAAHCVVKTCHRVILGQHNLKRADNIQDMRIGKVFKHPKFKERLSMETMSMVPDYDITLIKLKSPAQMNERVSPVCVAETGDNLTDDMKCVATGWGRTHDQRSTDKLQQVCVPLLSNSTCNTYYKGEITSRMLCAGAAGGDTCHGDSGGPLVCKKNGAWTLVGVTSWGMPDCPINMPRVYSSITVLRAWMDQTMANN